MEKYLEIMQAVDICTDPTKDCSDCPRYGKNIRRAGMTCCTTAARDMLDALRELLEENRSLRDVLGEVEMERNRLYTECNELREKLKNRPEVGFDADAFDFALARITRECDVSARVSGAAKYWRGFADGLKWCFRAYFKDTGPLTELSEALMRKKMEEGGDDV